MMHLFRIYIYICINLFPLFVARWLIHIYSHARIREENKPELSSRCVSRAKIPPSYLFIRACKYESGLSRKYRRAINIFRDLNHKLNPQTNLPANSCFRSSNSSLSIRRMRLPYIYRNIAGEALRRRLLRDETRTPCQPNGRNTDVCAPITSIPKGKVWNVTGNVKIADADMSLRFAQMPFHDSSKGFQIIFYTKKRIPKKPRTGRYCWFKREYVREFIFKRFKTSD